MARTGSTKHTIGGADDLVAAHAAHSELEAALSRYIYRATRDIVYELNIREGTVGWSEAIYEQLGYGKREPVHTLEWWTSHIHPDDALHVEQKLSDWLLGQESTWACEYRLRKADGSYCYMLDRGIVVRDDAGEPVRIVGTLLDITKQKELERAKDEFISLVSHQLRTPLTVIRVYGEMFAAGLFGQLTGTQATHIARMTDASIRLISLVDDILDLSRIEMGNYDVMRAWTDLGSLLQQCIQDVQPLADGKGVELSLDSDPSPLKAYTDREMVEQIVANLLTNAIRYSQPQRGRVEVRCYAAKSEAIIAVKDNGIGIPKADQEHIFERFYRARNAANIEEHGTGLGLYIVKSLAKTLGGRVWFETARGKGTTFYLALPLK